MKRPNPYPQVIKHGSEIPVIHGAVHGRIIDTWRNPPEAPAKKWRILHCHRGYIRLGGSQSRHESLTLLAGTPADEIAPWQPDQFFVDRFSLFETGRLHGRGGYSQDIA